MYIINQRGRKIKQRVRIWYKKYTLLMMMTRHIVIFKELFRNDQEYKFISVKYGTNRYSIEKYTIIIYN
ncbi:MAG: hypothetical protein ACLTXR_08110 [Clostridia bacterium]